MTYSAFASLVSRQGVAVKQISGPEPEFVGRAVRGANPKLLVVDTFPRGIVGEIAELVPSLLCPAVLIQRYLNPSYLRQFKVAAFLGQHYRLAVRITDALEPQTLSQRTVDVPPVTVREARELPPARSRSGWLFVDWGEGSEPYLQVALEAARQRRKQLRILRPGESYPAVNWMPSAELVIGAGGYNLFHEVALTSTPAIFVPCRRMYDDQFGRTVNAPHARTPEACAHSWKANRRPHCPRIPGRALLPLWRSFRLCWQVWRASARVKTGFAGAKSSVSLLPDKGTALGAGKIFLTSAQPLIQAGADVWRQFESIGAGGDFPGYAGWSDR